MLTILHFADAHIDMANYGRHDPESGLPVRVIDFLKSLDTIVDTAIEEKVDLVLFAGDAYKDRNPAPTFQREWGRRIIRLSKANIPTLLLVGNHDLSPALGRAHAIEEFNTLEVPYVHVINRPTFIKPEHIDGLPVQILALPWISRSGMMAHSSKSIPICRWSSLLTPQSKGQNTALSARLCLALTWCCRVHWCAIRAWTM